MSNRLPEGEQVAFIGEPSDTLNVDDRGRVIQAAGEGSHVRWTTGASKGVISLIPNFDLVPIRSESSEEGLEGPLVTIAVRDVYDRQGTTGLLNALNRDGHLSFFEPLAREAVEMIEENIRTDASFRPILSHLSSSESEELIALATSTLLRDAFGVV